MMTANPFAVDINDLTYAYKNGPKVLDIAAIQIAAGEHVFLHGPSGSGKTTLLGLLAGILVPQGGSLQVLGQDLAALRSAQRDRFRSSHVGYIFQIFNLIPYLNVRENITLPCHLSQERKMRLGALTPDEAAFALSRQLNIASLLDRPVTELSVGQQQRVAAARALIGAPEFIIADEPTSALDSNRRQEFIELLFAAADQAKATILFVSHDHSLAPLFTRNLSLLDLNRASRSGEVDA